MYKEDNIILRKFEKKDIINKVKENKNRYDTVIEYYITLEENNYKRMGISYVVSRKIINYGFSKLELNKIWLCVDYDNIASRELYDKGKMIDRCMYGIIKEEWSDINEYINN